MAVAEVMEAWHEEVQVPFFFYMLLAPATLPTVRGDLVVFPFARTG